MPNPHTYTRKQEKMSTQKDKNRQKDKGGNKNTKWGKVAFEGGFFPSTFQPSTKVIAENLIKKVQTVSKLIEHKIP